jgi:hypothetical protein
VVPFFIAWIFAHWAREVAVCIPQIEAKAPPEIVVEKAVGLSVLDITAVKVK